MNTNEKDEKLIQLVRESMRHSMSDEEIGMPDVNAEYEKFMAQHQEKAKEVSLFSLRKIAAAIAVLMIISGMAYAAMLIVSKKEAKPADVVPTATETKVQTIVEEKTDTVVKMLPNVYDNVELGQIVSDLCQKYDVEAQFVNDDAKHIRLYLQTKDEATLDETIQLLNHFEKVNIEHTGNKLIIR